ncbi:MAG: hypothetical protein KAY32_12905 [Candidatus Eisenbacteria sp.]|nr:hypothetical protein [Candidatus Eisenbacteria bacterium]
MASQQLGPVLLGLVCVFLAPWAPAHAVFSDEQNLASIVCPCLLAPDSLVQAIASDLQLIRTEYPTVANIHFQRCNYILPGATEILLTAEARAQFLAGEHTQLNALHAEIGTPQVVESVLEFLELYFSSPYKPELLTRIIHDS